MKAVRNQPEGNGLEGVMQGSSSSRVLKRIEEYVREEPLMAVGQAAAAGFILRFLPLRSIFMAGIRLAAPLMLLNRIWAYTSQGSGSGTGKAASEPERREKTIAR